MTDASPIVGKESPVSEVPIFSYEKNGTTNSQNFFTFSVPPKKSYSTSRFAQYALKNNVIEVIPEQVCPHVLIADDDSFQHLYYQNFFQRSVDFDEMNINKDEFRIDLSYSGEELVEKFQALKGNGLEDSVLVIIDYNMGEDKLNGVNTAVKLREHGYSGHLVLRTSETKEYLIEQHEDFEQLLEEKKIDIFLEKNDLKGVKEIVQTYLRKVFNEK